MSSVVDFAEVVLMAWKGQLDVSQLFGKAAEIEARQEWSLAAVLYQTWLLRNRSDLAYAVHFNLGVVLTNDRDLGAAETAYREVLRLNPGFLQAKLNLGLVLELSGRIDEALAEWQWIVQNTDCTRQREQTGQVVTACNHLGRLLEQRKRYREATDYLEKSLLLEANQSDVLHHWVYLRQKQCAWPVYYPLAGVSSEAMRLATSALAMISISDDPAEQLAAAHRYVRTKLPGTVPAMSTRSRYGHEKLRIAYCSSDFCLHPVSMLTVELFELHDRDRFEIYAYCWSPEDGSPLRQRVIAAMDHFKRIDQLDDQAAARLIREDEIDILIDLQGQTSGARPGMLAYRPAPIQITYLGLPATTGLPSIDYVIADRYLIPEAEAAFYSEKPLYMPDVYQVSDRKRPVGEIPTRASCGLPEDAFVFCSLNNSFKYTPEVFAVWMNILRQVEGSVLWLLADNPWAERNLRSVAAGFGIEQSRLVFAGRVLPEQYLARYALADLFLDTFPFNAGTTANDALWMGVPVLTRSGRCFASRMAGALLTAAGLSELIAEDLPAYEEKAIALARQPEEVRRLKAHLQQVRHSGVLFDTERFTRNLEERFIHLLATL